MKYKANYEPCYENANQEPKDFSGARGQFQLATPRKALLEESHSCILQSQESYAGTPKPLKTPHRPAINLQHKTSQTTFDTFTQSQHLLHTLQILCSVFNFLEIIKHMPKMLLIFFHL